MFAKKVELVPYTELLGYELEDYARATHDIVMRTEVQRHLGGLLLCGVVRRHSQSPEVSLRHAKRARDLMVAERGRFMAFAVTESVPHRLGRDNYIGTASIECGLELRKQWLPLRPPIARRLGWPLSRLEDNLGANAVAWIDPGRQGHLAETAAAQYQLRSAGIDCTQDGPLWRIVPIQAAHEGGMDDVMHAAGFISAVEDDGYFDDREVDMTPMPYSGKRMRLPESFLYKADVLPQGQIDA